METYDFEVLLKVQVNAFNRNDAYEIVHDTFGEGNACGLDVVDFEVTHVEQL